MKFVDNFNDKNNFINNWEITSKNDANCEISNNTLSLVCVDYWNGISIRPKFTIVPNDILIEFDYVSSGNHYLSADKPYLALVNKNKQYLRDSRYNMLSPLNDCMLIYLLDNYDIDVRRKMYLYFGDKLLEVKDVNYPMTEKMHIVLKFNFGKLLFYINNTLIFNQNIKEYKQIGNELLLEINSNSYSHRTDYISNFKIINNIEYFIMQDNNYYIVKEIDDKSELLRIEDFDKHNGFNNINIINSLSELLSKSNYSIIKIE